MQDQKARDQALARVGCVADTVQAGLHQSDQSFLNRIIDSIADPIFVKNESLAWVLVNQAFCDFIGRRRDELLGFTDADIFPAEEAAVFNGIDQHVLDSGEPIINEEVLTSASTGTRHTIRTTKTSFNTDDGRRILVGIFTDLTALRQAQRELEAANCQLRRLAMNDALTNLPNRRSFEETLDKRLEIATTNGQPFAVLFSDLNGFKAINDSLGHEVGDELICRVGQRLSALCRGDDFVSRLGGDEFVLIAANASPSGARQLAKRMVEELSKSFQLAGEQVTVGASIGIACFPENATQRTELIRKADQAMYHAKRVTQQSIAFFDDIPAESITQSLADVPA